ncbi:MAG: RNase H-like domain-containing protein, partial [Rhabdochlamydiaceae bacterium]
PVAFYSHKMAKAERNYPVHEQELLAIILALKEWRCYLHGSAHPINIITDHQSLKYLNSQPHLSRRQARWVEYLQQFDIVISYREGKENVVADALSRRGDYKKEVEAEEEKEKREFGTSVPRLRYRIAAVTAIEDGDPVLLAELNEATKEDESLRDIVTNPQQHGYTMTEEGILKNQQGLIVVPNRRSLRTKIMKEFHDVPVSGHRGIEKTLRKLGKMFWWPGIRQEVQQYIGSCIACQSNKSSNKATAGLLHPLPIPSHAWESISMDFVGPLPVTNDGHDNILVVVDRLTKMVHLTACRITITAPQVASIIWREIIRHHGIPTSIITDRDPRFTSKFWQELWKLMGSDLRMSTAYHPQTDGQTERTNRIMEEILRNYVSDSQDDWDRHLTAVEIAINNSQQSSTQFTPFYLNHGRDIKLPMEVAMSRLDSSKNPSAAESIKQLHNDIEKAKEAIKKSQTQQGRYANQHRRLAPNYQEGDRVMLSTENMRQFGGKLVSKYVGPLKVLEASEDKTVNFLILTSLYRFS